MQKNSRTSSHNLFMNIHIFNLQKIKSPCPIQLPTLHISFTAPGKQYATKPLDFCRSFNRSFLTSFPIISPLNFRPNLQACLAYGFRE